MKKLKAVSWVVYRMSLHGKPGEVNAVCQQAEWDAMELSNPGHHTLIRAGIATEAEAEKLARAGLVAAELAQAEERKRMRRS